MNKINFNNLELAIISKLKSLGLKYVKINNNRVMKDVYKLYINNSHSSSENDIYLYYEGIYETHIKKNCELAEKHFLRSADRGNSYAMKELARIYWMNEMYNKSEEYHLKAINFGNDRAMNNYAILCKMQGDYDLAEKYYLMAIERGNVVSMFNLSNLYGDLGKWDLKEKYLLMAIDKGDHEASMNNLAIFYIDRDEHELAEKYLLMSINKGNITAMENIAEMYRARRDVVNARNFTMLAAGNFSRNSIIEANKMINGEFNLEEAIKISTVLNTVNHHVLNTSIVIAIKLLKN